MSELDSAITSVLANRYKANADRIRELAAPLSNSQFWQKPFPYGNSFGHLVLHLTGNLNYYIGAQIANTGYVRDRPREFADSNPPSKEAALQGLDSAVAMVIDTIHQQTLECWSKAYSGIGTNCAIRLDILIHCSAHMQHHIGQMIYLTYHWERQGVLK